MTLEAVETNLTAADVSEDELWNLEEFSKYKVKLVHNGGEGKIVDFESYKGEMDKQLWDGSRDGKTKGIIEILTHHDFVVSDYFIASTYKDASGKENKKLIEENNHKQEVINGFTDDIEKFSAI